MTGPGLQPWDRRPAESPRAWAAFNTYRDIGPGRTYQKVADRLHKSGANYRRWGTKHDWRDRAGAWDAEQDRLWQEEVTADRHRIAKRHVQLAGQLYSKVLQRLSTMDPADLSPGEVRLWMEAALKIERAVYGLGDDEARAVNNGITVIFDQGLQLPATVTAETFEKP
jgi:hypothetical protein